MDRQPEKATEQANRRLWPTVRLQLVAALVLTLGLVVATIALRSPRDHSGVWPSLFWVEKVRWHQCADMVLVGDSRTGCDLSPTEMARQLDGFRIYNFGFNAAALVDDFLGAAEQVLDPQSPTKVIVLGVTPQSLTSYATRNNTFLENRPKASEFCIDVYVGDLLPHVEPFDFGHILSRLRGREITDRVFSEYHPDGWLAQRQVPEAVERSLASYRKVFLQSRVSPDIQKALMETVRRWTQSGIRVYAFRPPTSPEMFELESAMSGFDEKAFVADFTRAGGVWLSVPPCGYHSHDGSHLRPDEALRFSADLAHLIRHDLEQAGRLAPSLRTADTAPRTTLASPAR